MRIWKRGVVIAVVALVFASSASSARADIPLGIVIDDTPKGVEVKEVAQGGIADRFMPRLRPGAHIVTVNGIPVKSAQHFAEVMRDSNFARFQFVDVTGELRWANAWSGGRRQIPYCP